MLDMLKGGIIKGRVKKYNDTERAAHHREIDASRAKGLTDRDIAKQMKISYFTVAKRAEAETNY